MMRLSPVFRLLGALVYGFIGYELGIALTGTAQLTNWTAPLIWGPMFGGALLGYFLAPWIMIAPAQAARDSLRGVPLADLLAGTVGLSCRTHPCRTFGLSYFAFARSLWPYPAFCCGHPLWLPGCRSVGLA